MIIKFKSIRNWKNHIYYLFDESKHQHQQIIDFDFHKKFNKNKELIDKYHFGKNGRRSQMISVLISFPKNTDKIDAESRFKTLFLSFYSFINETHSLGLYNDELKQLVNNIPYVFHGKQENPHFHSFLNRVIYSKSQNKLISIDFSKKKYLNKLRQLAGWDISKDKIGNKTTNNYAFKLDKLKEEILRYRNINNKLDKYISIALNDLKKGRTENALKKLNKIKERNNHYDK